MTAERAPTTPSPAPPDVVRTGFVRGRERPRAVEWFGVRSFWGHIWRGAAIAVLTDQIDSRDWMRADTSEELTRRVAKELGGDPAASSLTEAIGGDFWLDFIADTGDDATVSKAVGRLLFATYDVADPDDPSARLLLPRGHMLVFGGDTAYPVATDLEIAQRVVRPFNRVLEGVDDGRPRALLGVPGNHDWFGGLDGFGRLFHERRGDLAQEAPPGEDDAARGNLEHFVQWVEALTVGDRVHKRRVLRIEGYTPMQRASYWALHFAPSLDGWGVDRQLSHVDFQQRLFFRDQPKDRGLFLFLPEPVYAFFEPHVAGQEMLQALGLSVGRDGLFVLTGDLHHYSRLDLDPGMQVIAGGGGAFLHPARIARRSQLRNVAAEFPGPLASRALARHIPLAVLTGRAGLGVHITFTLTYLAAFGLDRAAPVPLYGPPLAFLVAAVIAFGTAGFRPGRRLTTALSCVTTASVVAVLPFFVRLLASPLERRTDLAEVGIDGVLFGLSVLGAVIASGFFLMFVVLRGLAHGPFGALSHPGYKHFVRLRFRKDGSAVDGWVLGQVDPLREGEPVVLVDHFTWKNPRPSVERS